MQLISTASIDPDWFLDIDGSVTRCQRRKIEGTYYPAPRHAPDPSLAPVLVLVATSTGNPAVIAELGQDHDVRSTGRGSAVDFHHVVGGGMLHDRECLPLLLDRRADGVDPREYLVRAGLPHGVRCPNYLPADWVAVVGTHAVVVGQPVQCEFGLDSVQASGEIL